MSSKNKPDLVYVDEKSVKALQDLAKVIKAQSTTRPSPLTKRLNREIRDVVEPMRADIARAGGEINFKRSSRSSSSRSKRGGRTLKSGKFKAGKGLRQEIKAGVATKIDSSAYSAGVRVRMASKKKDVNAIGKAINYDGFVRHPNRSGKGFSQSNADKKNGWSNTETTNGKGWFYRGAAPHMRTIPAKVAKVLDQWTRDLARQIDRAA